MFLAIRELLFNKSRYISIMAILTLLLFLVLFLAGLANGLAGATSATIEAADASVYILSNDSDDIITRSTITAEQFENIEQKNKDVTPINLQRTVIQRENDDTKIDITYLAVEPDSFMLPPIIEGETISNMSKRQIILNSSFKDEGIDLGDTILDATTQTKLEVIGFTKHQFYGHSSIGVISQSTYQDIRSTMTSKNMLTYNAVVAGNGQLVENIETIENTTVLSKKEIISKIPGHTQEQTTITLILATLLIISSFIVGIFFYILTIQKLSQLGILKALGMNMKMLSTTMLWQVLILSVTSVLIGNILVAIISSVLPNKMPFILNGRDTLIISVLFIVISVLTSLISLRKVAKVDPLTAIGGNE